MRRVEADHSGAQGRFALARGIPERHGEQAKQGGQCGYCQFHGVVNLFCKGFGESTGSRSPDINVRRFGLLSRLIVWIGRLR